MNLKGLSLRVLLAENLAKKKKSLRIQSQRTDARDEHATPYEPLLRTLFVFLFF